jgi:hypothetical protein
MWHVWWAREMHTGIVDKSKDKRRLGRPRHGWEENTEVDLQPEREWTGLIWLTIWARDVLL